jgi:cytochrome bd-type quinol oxidase subunit 2
MKFILIFIFLVTVALPTSASIIEKDILEGAGGLIEQENAFGDKAGFEIDVDLGNTAEAIISAFLSILGVIFVILIIIAGYNWMTAAGDEQKVTKAKDTIRRAIIGLIIIVAAYAITYFVFTSMPFGSGAGSQT